MVLKIKILKIKRHKYKSRVFAIILITAILPLIALGIFSYITYTTELSEKSNISMKATLNQVSGRVDEVLNKIREYYIEAGDKDEIKWLMQKGNLDYSQQENIDKASKILRGPVYLMNYIEGYTFINYEDDWVLSNIGMYRLHDASNKEVADEIYENSGTLLRYFWTNRLDVERPSLFYSNRIDDSGYFFVIKLPVLNDSKKSMLMVKLNKNNLFWLIREDLGAYDISVANMDGKLLFTTNSLVYNWINKNTENVGIFDRIETIKTENEKFKMAVKKDFKNRLIFAASYNENLVSEGADRILSFAMILIAVVIAVLVLSRISTGWLYRPVQKLTGHLSGIIGSEGNSNEFEMIEKGFDTLINNKLSLEQIIESQQGMLIELFALRLIRGEASAENIEQSFARFKLQKQSLYCLVAVHCFSPDEKTADQTNQDAIRLMIVENIPLEIKWKLFMPPLSHTKAILLVFGGDDEKSIDGRIFEVCRDFSKYAQNAFGCKCSFGVSRPFSDLLYFRSAFNESIEAMKNCSSLYGDLKSDEVENVMFYSDFALNSNAPDTYDILAKREIQAAIDEFDMQKAFEISDFFVDHISNTKIILHEKYFYMYRFLISIVQTAMDAGLCVNQIFKGEETNLFQQFNQIYDSKQIKDFYKFKVIKPIIEELGKFRMNSPSGLLEKIINLVKESNGDITLTECADKLGCHPSYIWKILKSKRNISFSDFTMAEKLNAAKKMLIETDLPVAEIAQKLNYTNAQNFIRFFNKHEGITPGKYRMENKK